MNVAHRVGLWPNFPHAKAILSTLTFVIFLPCTALAQPVLPAVWYYRDSFDGNRSIEAIDPAKTNRTANPDALSKGIPLENITTLWLIIPADSRPAPIEFAGRSYFLREEGLYRFMSSPADRRTPADSGIRNLIILRSVDSTIPLLRGLSRLLAHGNRDDIQPLPTLRSRLIDCSWIILTCGHARDLAMSVMRELSLKYQTRPVNTIAIGESKNGFDDGHSMFEVLGGAFPRWTVVDIDQGLLFRTTGDEFLDTTSLIGALAKGTSVRYEELSPKEFDLEFPGRDRMAGYNFAVYQQASLRDPQARARWYRRLLQEQKVE